MAALQALLDAGAAVDAVDEQGRTALYMAAATGRDDILLFLCERGADPSMVAKVDGRTPLHAAAAGGHVRACELLIQHCPSSRLTQMTDARGLTAAELGHSGRHLDVVRALLQAHADRVRASRSKLGASPSPANAPAKSGALHGQPVSLTIVEPKVAAEERRQERRGYMHPVLHSPERSVAHGSIFNRVKTP